MSVKQIQSRQYNACRDFLYKSKPYEILANWGFAAPLQVWLPCRGAGSAKPRLRCYCTDLPLYIDCFVSQCLCRVRRVADPCKVNSHKSLHKSQADDICTYTIMLIYNIKIICLTAASSTNPDLSPPAKNSRNSETYCGCFLLYPHPAHEIYPPRTKCVRQRQIYTLFSSFV